MAPHPSVKVVVFFKWGWNVVVEVNVTHHCRRLCFWSMCRNYSSSSSLHFIGICICFSDSRTAIPFALRRWICIRNMWLNCVCQNILLLTNARMCAHPHVQEPSVSLTFILNPRFHLDAATNGRLQTLLTLMHLFPIFLILSHFFIFYYSIFRGRNVRAADKINTKEVWKTMKTLVKKQNQNRDESTDQSESFCYESLWSNNSLVDSTKEKEKTEGWMLLNFKWQEESGFTEAAADWATGHCGWCSAHLLVLWCGRKEGRLTFVQSVFWTAVVVHSAAVNMLNWIGMMKSDWSWSTSTELLWRCWFQRLISFQENGGWKRPNWVKLSLPWICTEHGGCDEIPFLKSLNWTGGGSNFFFNWNQPCLGCHICLLGVYGVCARSCAVCLRLQINRMYLWFVYVCTWMCRDHSVWNVVIFRCSFNG